LCVAAGDIELEYSHAGVPFSSQTSMDIFHIEQKGELFHEISAVLFANLSGSEWLQVILGT